MGRPLLPLPLLDLRTTLAHSSASKPDNPPSLVLRISSRQPKGRLGSSVKVRRNLHNRSRVDSLRCLANPATRLLRLRRHYLGSNLPISHLLEVFLANKAPLSRLEQVCSGNNLPHSHQRASLDSSRQLNLLRVFLGNPQPPNLRLSSLLRRWHLPQPRQVSTNSRNSVNSLRPLSGPSSSSSGSYPILKCFANQV